jgi:hypothetical protein
MDLGSKQPRPAKRLLRGFWLASLVLVIGAILFWTGRPTSLPRMAGLVLMLGSLPLGMLVVLVSWLRHRTAQARRERLARRAGAGREPRPGAARRPAGPVRARRAARPAAARAGR